MDTPRGWMEYHANCFASFLLMPRVAFERGLREVQKELGISQHLGEVWETPANLADVQATVKELGELFGTSPTATKYHLENLGLLNSTVPARRSPKGPFAFPT